jgi:hypothetical protein
VEQEKNKMADNNEAPKAAGDLDIITKEINNKDVVAPVDDKEEARKKMIEKFAMSENTVAETPDTSKSEVKEEVDRSYDASPFGETTEEEPRMELVAPPKNHKKEIVLLVLIIIFGIWYIWTTYLEDSVFNVREVLNKPAVISQEVKQKYLVDNTPEFPSTEIQVNGASLDRLEEQNLAREEARRDAMEQRIARLEAKKKLMQAQSYNADPVVQPSVISEKWKIKNVEENGLKVTVHMVGTDREINISTGDTVVEVGLINSIRKTDGKWYVIGSKKVISE